MRARTAACTVLVSVMLCTGRSSSDTLRSAETIFCRHAATAGCCTWLVSTTKGTSDHAACRATQAVMATRCLPNNASSVTHSVATPFVARASTSSMLVQTSTSRPARRSSAADAGPSRPIGA